MTAASLSSLLDTVRMIIMLPAESLMDDDLLFRGILRLPATVRRLLCGQANINKACSSNIRGVLITISIHDSSTISSNH